MQTKCAGLVPPRHRDVAAILTLHLHSWSWQELELSVTPRPMGMLSHMHGRRRSTSLRNIYKLCGLEPNAEAMPDKQQQCDWLGSLSRPTSSVGLQLVRKIALGGQIFT
jgi:hypothetical protein